VIYGLNAKGLHIRMILSREDGKALICTLSKRISRAGQKEGKFKFLQCQDPRQGKQGRGPNSVKAKMQDKGKREDILTLLM
jgi:hypothetical protein